MSGDPTVEKTASATATGGGDSRTSATISPLDRGSEEWRQQFGALPSMQRQSAPPTAADNPRSGKGSLVAAIVAIPAIGGLIAYGFWPNAGRPVEAKASAPAVTVPTAAAVASRRALAPPADSRNRLVPATPVAPAALHPIPHPATETHRPIPAPKETAPRIRVRPAVPVRVSAPAAVPSRVVVAPEPAKPARPAPTAQQAPPVPQTPPAPHPEHHAAAAPARPPAEAARPSAPAHESASPPPQQRPAHAHSDGADLTPDEILSQSH